MKIPFLFLLLLSLTTLFSQTLAHHILGRPAYGLNEDSNTPPSTQIENFLGKFFVTYMVYPAFPRPNVAGRINLYVTTIEENQSFDGNITFEIKADSYFSDEAKIIGVQQIDDNVYRQKFVVEEVGDYIVTARFTDNDKPYAIDFPLRIGVPSQITWTMKIVAGIFILLMVVSFIQRRRLRQMRIRDTEKRQW